MCVLIYIVQESIKHSIENDLKAYKTAVKNHQLLEIGFTSVIE